MTAKEFREKLNELLEKCPDGVELFCIASDEESNDYNHIIQGIGGNLKNMIANVLIEDSIFTQIILDAVKDILILAIKII